MLLLTAGEQAAEAGQAGGAQPGDPHSQSTAESMPGEQEKGPSPAAAAASLMLSGGCGGGSSPLWLTFVADSGDGARPLDTAGGSAEAPEAESGGAAGRPGGAAAAAGPAEQEGADRAQQPPLPVDSAAQQQQEQRQLRQPPYAAAQARTLKRFTWQREAFEFANACNLAAWGLTKADMVASASSVVSISVSGSDAGMSGRGGAAAAVGGDEAEVSSPLRAKPRAAEGGLSQGDCAQSTGSLSSLLSIAFEAHSRCEIPRSCFTERNLGRARLWLCVAREGVING